jgi:intracellular sulfur oxidation DsrE/DsrF family protein
MRTAVVLTTLVLFLSSDAGAQGPTAPAPAPLPGKNSPAPDPIADCMQLWEKATHMTKQEWAATCWRVQNRVDNTKLIPLLAAAKPASPKPSASPPAAANKVAIQVNQNDKAVMDLALNNAKNVLEYYKDKGETIAVEIVTFGPGLHMLRADTSPVKDRIAPMSLENPNLKFVACANTQANQSKAEGKPVTLISEAKVMPSGVVRLMELQEQGYSYIRP